MYFSIKFDGMGRGRGVAEKTPLSVFDPRITWVADIGGGQSCIRHQISLGIILWCRYGYLTTGWPQICLGRDGGYMKYIRHHASPYSRNHGKTYQPVDGTLAIHIGPLVT
ncbi:hypothetical protein D3C72_2172520 [compost metagenome]